MYRPSGMQGKHNEKQIILQFKSLPLMACKYLVKERFINILTACFTSSWTIMFVLNKMGRFKAIWYLGRSNLVRIINKLKYFNLKIMKKRCVYVCACEGICVCNAWVRHSFYVVRSTNIRIFIRDSGIRQWGVNPPNLEITLNPCF